jgi:hypothetical protein
MRETVFGPAREGFWPDGGWFTNSKGEIKGIRAKEGRWTRKQSESELGSESEVTEVVLPWGVTAITGDSFRGYAMLRSLTIQPGCVTIEDGTGSSGKSQRCEGAMAGCSSLLRATIPGTCATIGGLHLLRLFGPDQRRDPFERDVRRVLDVQRLFGLD